ncbi:McrB family protein [Cyclobacterium amurskyense]|uniref:ATPase AAA n=1 Tax=Cyclobacterium amurskyense TaxID=320787 RepID=A0A0H4PAP0_9BACT|nr:hypothetical protein [Cyclobacterium amurskyense]AKP51496.1 ATPase AAA [Cyclobacterium amurskyense]
MREKKCFYVKLSCPSSDDGDKFLLLFQNIIKYQEFESDLDNIPNNLEKANDGDIIFVQIGGDFANKRKYFKSYPSFINYENGLQCVGEIIKVNQNEKVVSVKLIGLKKVITKEDLYFFPQFINNLGPSTKGTPNQAGLYELDRKTGFSLIEYLYETKVLDSKFTLFEKLEVRNELFPNALFEFEKFSEKNLNKKLFQNLLSSGNPEENFSENIIIKEFIDWFNRTENFKESYKGIVNKENLKFWNEIYFKNEIFKIRSEDADLSFDRIKKIINNNDNNDWNEFNLSCSKGAPKAVLGEKNYLKFLKEYLKNNSHKFSSKLSEFDIKEFVFTLKEVGFIYESQIITRFIASLLTKPFVILTGLSGSGKTKLAQAFVEWICQDEEQYCIIPVGADWTNREPLLGYPNALEPDKYVKPDSGVLDLIIRANSSPELPHFLILDEMNLSHVERYFADFLSVMESKKEIPLYDDKYKVENGVPSKLKLPENLFIIGTVNIDETTNMFSPKVLDRANTIEFRVDDTEMEYFLKNIKKINMEALKRQGASMGRSFIQLSENKSFTTEDLSSINDTLLLFFKELSKTGAEFGYRSASEILQLINQLSILDDNLRIEEKIDIAIMQKLLPKLHGSRGKLHDTLVTLGLFCLKEKEKVKIENDIFNNHDFNFNSTSVRYPLSLEKIARMYKGAIVNGFTSFAEA